MTQDMSPTIGKLAEALARAQAIMSHAVKDGVNEFYKRNGEATRYNTLTSVWDACREPLSNNGLAITQLVQDIGGLAHLTTMLIHISGEWIKSSLPLKPKDQHMQGIGSAITYARRYGLSSMVGIFPDEDDDAEKSEGRGDEKKFKSSEKVIAIREPQAAFTVTAPSSLHDEIKKAIQGNDSGLKQILEYNKVSTIEEMSDDQCRKALNTFLRHKVRGA